MPNFSYLFLRGPRPSDSPDVVTGTSGITPVSFAVSVIDSIPVEQSIGFVSSPRDSPGMTVKCGAGKSSVVVSPLLGDSTV